MDLKFLVFALALMVISANAYADNTTCNVILGSCGTNATTTINVIHNTTNKTGKPIYMMMTYAPGCPHCERLSNYIQELNSTYDIRVTYINAITNQSLVAKYLSYYNVPEGDWVSVPQLFVGTNYCIGDTPCISLLSDNIANFSKTGVPQPSISGTLSSLSILEITGLALVDSVNPCAIAVLILLLSTFFMRNPNKRYKLLLAGFAFALGIFVFYFMIGIFLLLGIKSALAITDLRNVYIYTAFGVFSIVLGLLNLKDYFHYGILGFTMEVPMRWKPKMGATLDMIVLKLASIPGAFIAGVAVTAFLLPCITGPYIVAGSLLSGLNIFDASLWLAFYNFLFVLPMLIITTIIFFGFSSIEKASEFRERNVKKLHLIAGILLIIVGAIMLSSVLL